MFPLTKTKGNVLPQKAPTPGIAGGRATHRRRAPARGKAAQGLSTATQGLPPPAPGMRQGAETVLDKNLLRERRKGEREKETEVKRRTGEPAEQHCD